MGKHRHKPKGRKPDGISDEFEPEYSKPWNEPTFVVSNRKEVTDVALGTNKIRKLASNWHESGEPFLSDHGYIL
jgi:hypothetical protein